MLFAMSSVPYFLSSQAISRQRFIAAPAFGRPRGARLGGRGGALAEQPRFRRLQLLDVVAVVGKEGASSLDFAHARELKLESYALLVALAAELVHLGAQFLGGIGGLGRLGDLALQLPNLGVALRERCLVVRAHLGGSVAVGSLQLRRHRRLRCLIDLHLRLTRDLHLRDRAIVPVTHERVRLSPRVGK